MTQIQLSPHPKKVIPMTDFSENQSHPCFYYYWQLPKVSCILINKCRSYSGDNIIWHKFNYVPPSPKKWSPWQIFLKINTIHVFTITDNFPKFRVYWSTNVGAIQATTYCDTNLTKSPSQKKWSPWQICLKINPIHAFIITDNLPKFRVNWSTNEGAIVATTYYDTRTDWRTDGLTDWRTDGSKTLYPHNFVAWGIIKA